MSEEQNAVINLDQPRVISFRDRGFAYSYKFGRLAQSEWEHYFDSFVLASENDSKGVTNQVDVFTAGAALVRKKVASVEGYAGSFGDNPNWRDVLPVAHVALVHDILISVDVVQPEILRPIDPLIQEVMLSALWTSRESGKMEKLSGLVHRFAPPMLDHERRYNRAMSETRVIRVGGSRSGRTIFPVRQKVLLALYDELIEGVEGYAVGGAALSGREQIAREMDAFHKAKAVAELFAPTVIEEAAAA